MGGRVLGCTFAIALAVGAFFELFFPFPDENK
jgi:hypothetical protein